MDIALRLGAAAQRRNRVRAAAVIVGACAQLAWAGCWAADALTVPDVCKSALLDDQVSITTNADTEEDKVAEVVDKIEKNLPKAFGIARHDELKQIVTGITRELMKRKPFAVLDLNNGIEAACTALQGEGSKPFAAATAAGFGAARLPVPPTISANFATTGSDETGSKFAFMTGVVNSLEADGSWKSAVEASFISTTQFLGPRLQPPAVRAAEVAEEREAKAAARERQAASRRAEAAAKREGKPAPIESDDAETSDAGFSLSRLVDKSRTFGRFEVTWSAIGKIDDEQDPAEPTTNPFAAGGGILRLNVGPEIVMGQGWWGLTAGIGLTTQPTDTEDDPTDAEDADVDALRRWYAGVLFLADYGSSKENAEHVTGRVAIGYSDDKFWEWEQTVAGSTTPMMRDESKRWFLDARIDGPGVFQSKSVKLSLRMYVDHPKSGDGPTDIRVSLLVTADLGLLFGK